MSSDAVDKAHAWDAIAEKNARIAELEAELQTVQWQKAGKIAALERAIAAARARIEELERDAVDKARAWDEIAKKNARIEELEAALRDIFSCPMSAPEGAVHWIRERARAALRGEDG